MNSYAKILRNHPLFSPLPGRVLNRLAENASVQEFSKGSLVVREGDPGEYLFLVLTGRCQSSMLMSDGSEQIFNIYGPGDTFGERALLSNDRFWTTIRVLTACSVLRIEAAELRKAVEKMGHKIDAYYKGVGCKRCRNTGFSGRIGVHELLVINDQLRDVIVSDPSIVPIRNIARDRGMVTLQHDGFRKVREGITTVEEIMHISGEFRE